MRPQPAWPCFDPRPRTGGDQPVSRGPIVKLVSIRAPARGATANCRSADCICLFRSAPPHGGRRAGRCWRARQSSFDPRPRTGGDTRGNRIPSPGPVSIRAPARGATSVTHLTDAERSVSIRAPARGATPRPTRPGRRSARFDPRPRTGGDFNVTVPPRSTVTFRSAPPHGGRPVCGSVTKRSLQFRSAPPHGGRRQGADSASIPKCFDPRPRTGGDILVLWCTTTVRVSIRAPARGATARHRHAGRGLDVSIRAPARGATAEAQRIQADHIVSIRAPARGATAMKLGFRFDGSGFDPRPRTGGDQERCRPCRNLTLFRSAPPHGGRQPVGTTSPDEPSFRSAPPHGGRL